MPNFNPNPFFDLNDLQRILAKLAVDDDFTDRYLTELHRRKIISSKLKKAIEHTLPFIVTSNTLSVNKTPALRWLLHQGFPVLSTRLPNSMLNPTRKSLKKALDRQRDSATVPVLSVENLVILLSSLTAKDSVTIDDTGVLTLIKQGRTAVHYQLLDCYSTLFVAGNLNIADLPTLKTEQIPLVLKYAIINNQTSLITWFLSHQPAQDINYFNRYNQHTYSLLNLAFASLINDLATLTYRWSPNQHSNTVLPLDDSVGVNKKLTIIGYLVQQGAKTTDSVLRCWLIWLIVIDRRYRQQFASISALSISEQDLLNHNKWQLSLAKLFASLLLTTPNLVLVEGKVTLLQQIIAAVFKDQSQAITPLPAFDNQVFKQQLAEQLQFYEQWQLGVSLKKRTHHDYSATFFKAILAEFFSRYRHATHQNQLALVPNLTSHLLDYYHQKKMSASLISVKTLATQLMTAGIGLDHVDDWGMTLLHKAVLCQQLTWVDKLTSAGLNLNAQSLSQHTPLQLALIEYANEPQAQSESVINHLINQAECDLTKPDKHSWTPLHLVVTTKNVALLQRFLRISLARNSLDLIDKQTIRREPAALKDSTWAIVQRTPGYMIKPWLWFNHHKTAIMVAESQPYSLAEQTQGLATTITAILENHREEVIKRARAINLTPAQTVSSMPVATVNKQQSVAEATIDSPQDNFDSSDAGNVTTNPMLLTDTNDQQAIITDTLSSVAETTKALIEKDAEFDFSNEISLIKQQQREAQLTLKRLVAQQQQLTIEQQAHYSAAEFRLSQLETLLKEEQMIAASYHTIVGDDVFRRSYYQRLRAELGVNFTAVLMLGTKLIGPRSGKVDDATASHSVARRCLNITTLASEVSHPLAEAATTVLEYAKVAAHCVKTGAQGAAMVADGVPVVSQVIGVVAGVSWVAEFVSELEIIGQGHQSLLDLTLKDLDQLAEKLALLMTARVSPVLALLTAQGRLQLADFGYRRLLLGVLQGKLKATTTLEAFVETLCQYQLKQGRFLVRLPKMGKVALIPSAIAKAITDTYGITVLPAQLPSEVEMDENWLHHGLVDFLKHYCDQHKINLPRLTATASSTSTTTQPVQTTAVSAQTPSLAVVAVKQPGQVQSTVHIYDRLKQLDDELEKKDTRISYLEKTVKVLVAEKEQAEQKIADIKTTMATKTDLQAPLEHIYRNNNAYYYPKAKLAYQKGVKYVEKSQSQAALITANPKANASFFKAKAIKKFDQAMHKLNCVNSDILAKDNPADVLALKELRNNCQSQLESINTSGAVNANNNSK